MTVPAPAPGMTEPARVYVDMVGDLFHAGHVALLRAARELGDHLVVGVLSGPAVETGRLHLVSRSGAISTSDLIARVLTRSSHPTHGTGP